MRGMLRKRLRLQLGRRWSRIYYRYLKHFMSGLKRPPLRIVSRTDQSMSGEL
jgi:hypothetical protein